MPLFSGGVLVDTNPRACGKWWGMRYSAYLLVGIIGLLSGCSAPAVQPLDQYRMGEKVRLGRLIYTVFETQWLTQLGDAVTGRVPEHRFLFVRFSATNSGGGEEPVPALTRPEHQ